ncbi:MAG: DUF1553 domain-containing protein [Pirellula sp.]
MHMLKSPILIACLMVLIGWTHTAAQESEVSFAQDVQPLLARRCFACHGPDAAEAGLRLHRAEFGLAATESGVPAIVPGKPDESELMKRIASEEEGVRMPPEGKPLTAREQAILAAWIRSGAEWKQHWAFEPMLEPKVPPAVPEAGNEHPIDRFIDAKLARHGLRRAPRAEALALLRRVTFDLTGLPPTPEQSDAFLKRAAENWDQAWSEEIDRLLASEQYGERWARHWLDVVRYAETNSFERDGPKPNAWRYRDYVIRAFNQDKPYDQFLREQLAGDELPQITRDSLIATGFYRLGIWDDEPADRELALYDGLDDILTTVGQGILGLTLNCSRCHDHKIDPIPTADYYAALSFFRNITSNGYGPQVERPLVATEEDHAAFKQAEAAIRSEADQLQMSLSSIEKQLAEQLAEQSQSPTTTFDLDDLEYRFYRETFDRLPDFEQYKPETIAKLNPPLIDIGVATRPDFFGFVFTASLIVPEDAEYTFFLDSDDGSRLVLDGKNVLEYDGIHGLSTPRRVKVQLKQGRVPLRLEYFQGQFGKGLKLHWSGPGFKRRALTASSKEPIQDLNQAIQANQTEGLDPKLVAEFKRIRQQLEKTKQKKPWTEYGMCVSEQGTEPPQTHILTRGSPQGKANVVEPTFLSVLGGQRATITPNTQSNTSGRRLAFANWVTDPDHALTSRVFVNRIWQHHFGRGIVRSPNNFGQLGDPPTHPELLDYLAKQFVQGGWKMKSLHKLILTSQTYQQSVLASPETLAKDATNDWFSRFDMRRLSAEEIRDSVLAANGELNPKMYGPSIYPKLSKEVLASQSVPGKGWESSSPEDQRRRSVYIHVKRSLLVPMLSNFDFPEPDTSCEARFVTTQPGQALGMLNGDFLNEEAAKFAEYLRKHAGDSLDAQIAMGIHRTCSRVATTTEIERGRRLIADLQKEHSLSEQQALSYFCLFLFNLNEFVYLD